MTLKVIFVGFKKITILPLPLDALSPIWLVEKVGFQKFCEKLSFAKKLSFKGLRCLILNFEVI